jgi:predicted nucleotidyltransferase
MGRMDPVDRLLAALRPLLREQGARAAYLFGSRARGAVDPGADIDCIIVAPSRASWSTASATICRPSWRPGSA